MDLLNEIMTKQRELQERLGYNFYGMSAEERAEFMRNHFVYLVQELNEALYEMPFFKLWKDYSAMTDEAQAIAWAKVRAELVDALHFFVNLLLCADFSAEELYKMYITKNAENHRRQDVGYTADVSYKQQSLDDLPMCKVTMDGESQYADDFIAILNKSNGDASILYNTDTLSLGMAIRLVATEYMRSLDNCTDEEREQIHAVLNDSAFFNKEDFNE